MGSKSKQQTQQQNTNTWGYQQAPITPYTQAAINASDVTEDPSIQNRYASMEDDVRNSYDDPYGAYTSPDVRQKSMLSRLLKLNTERDKALSENRFNTQQQRFGNKVSIAQLTAPSLVQTGGSSSGTVTQSQPLFGQIMSGLGAVAGPATSALA